MKLFFSFWQENILQKVVMTAFADRTVVTIAVSDMGWAASFLEKVKYIYVERVSLSRFMSYVSHTFGDTV